MENNAKDEKSPFVKTKSEGSRYTFTARQLLIAAVSLLGLIALLVIWRNLSLNSAEKECNQQQAALQKRAALQLMDAGQRQLKLLAKPYTWAVRNALLQNDKARLNEYAADIVKEKNVVVVMVIDPKNTVVSSSDKKWEGRDYLTFGPAAHLNADSAVVQKVNDSLLVLASPVMGFNDKLGTVVLRYAVPKFVYNSAATQDTLSP